ncbi:MAG: SAM-dependent DNA methyltransferase, partial [SAR324 cluster bacterium]|nr:SAM-dependent DNA methyltransferase [SAR324 cluster bacterium]
MDIQELENKRQKIQESLDAEKSQTERNRLGQFATPIRLAREILAYSVAQLIDDCSIRFLDPAIGTGSFYSALLHTVPSDRILSASGYELDEGFADHAYRLWKDTNLVVKQHDFTIAVPSGNKSDLYNLL